MSDLISRSQLLKEIETWGGCVEALHEYIQNMPTAYDIDNVLEELCNADPQEMMSEEQRNVLNYAIEIVKHGGASDDVCEWRLCDEEANVYDTSCRNPHILIEGTPKENNYEYCPYCGKKIKEVE